MLRLFWNHDEGRLRAGWRLALHLLVLLILIAALGTLVIGVAGLALGPGAIELDPEVLAAPGGLLTQFPLVDILSNLSVLAAMALSIWFAGRFFDKRPFSSFGLRLNRRWWADFAFGLALGGVLMAAIFLVQMGAGWITITGTFYSPVGSFATGITTALILFVAVGIQEELLSRGYHLRNIAEGLNHPRIGPAAALMLGYIGSSAIFGALHLANPHTTWISTTNLVLAGLLLGLGYLFTGELAIPIGLHITWNFFQGNVFGFPVSGMGAGATLIAIQQGGPELWTGGPFGPEAGLIGLLAMTLGALLIYLWVRATRGRVKIQTHLARYGASPREELE